MKAQVKVKVSSGKPSGNGTAIAKAHIVVIKTDAQRRPAGRPIYATKAQMTAHFYYGQRPAKTQLRRAN